MGEPNHPSRPRPDLAEAMRHAAEHNLPVALSALEADSDPSAVAKRYIDFAQALYNERKDVTQMLAAARAGIRYCMDAADRVGTTDATGAQALKETAKVIAFNAAANSWPGWGDEGVRIDESHLSEAGELASICQGLVYDLDLGPDQTGNAHWLVGAIHMASGRYGEAIASFNRARDAFQTADNPASALMAAGYGALARKRADDPDWSPDEYEGILRQLRQDGTADGAAFAVQLVTADRLL
ncbi:MAG: hypothetical protein GY798_21540 [Hyphomicrobiales bacterium]|nr:hypothetical protein [Hyphomicrobiales bacterium]